MARCTHCYLCTGYPQEVSVPCAAKCDICDADAKTAGMFKRDKNVICSEMWACRDRLETKLRTAAQESSKESPQ